MKISDYGRTISNLVEEYTPHGYDADDLEISCTLYGVDVNVHPGDADNIVHSVQLAEGAPTFTPYDWHGRQACQLEWGHDFGNGVTLCWLLYNYSDEE